MWRWEGRAISEIGLNFHIFHLFKTYTFSAFSTNLAVSYYHQVWHCSVAIYCLYCALNSPDFQNITLIDMAVGVLATFDCGKIYLSIQSKFQQLLVGKLNEMIAKLNKEFIKKDWIKEGPKLVHFQIWYVMTNFIVQEFCILLSSYCETS